MECLGWVWEATHTTVSTYILASGSGEIFRSGHKQPSTETRSTPCLYANAAHQINSCQGVEEKHKIDIKVKRSETMTEVEQIEELNRSSSVAQIHLYLVPKCSKNQIIYLSNYIQLRYNLIAKGAGACSL